MVLSTLHTNDASPAPTRLAQMGLEPFLVASSLECVVGQRLARALCIHCRRSFAPNATELAAAGREMTALPPPRRISHAVGCPECRGSGYQGRFAVHDVMPVSAAIQGLILGSAPATAVGIQALSEGMRSLRADGLHKVAEGRTSLDELTRVASVYAEG